MLQMLAKLRQTREFERYLQQMDEEEVPRSSITSCIILSACKESSDWQKALDILSELKTTSEGQHSTNVPYLLAMTACARAREKDTVAKLLEEMKANPSAEVTRPLDVQLAWSYADLNRAYRIPLHGFSLAL